MHSCGFDSVPSDLGVLLAHEQAQADGEGPLEDTTLVVTDLRGGISGGTVESMRLQLEAARRDPATRRILADPYSLSPDRLAEPDLGPQRDAVGVSRDAGRGEWLAPFVMASYNTRVVRRSNALTDWAYGRRFRYREGMAFQGAVTGPVAAFAVTGGLAATMLGMRFGPTRALLDRVLPEPGEGPNEKTRTHGRFRVEVRDATTTRRVVHGGGRGPGRPRLRRDGGDARGERRGPGPRRGPAGPRWCADARDGAGGRARGPAAGRRVRAVSGGCARGPGPQGLSLLVRGRPGAGSAHPAPPSSAVQLGQDLAAEDLDPLGLVAADVVQVDPVEAEVDEALDLGPVLVRVGA